MIQLVNSLSEHYSKRLLLRILEINKSSYYELKRRDQRKKTNDAELIAAIQVIALKRPYYGYRRITKALNRQGLTANHKKVHLILRKEGLLCKRKRKYIATTDSKHSHPIFPNLAPKMQVTGINQLWAADITYIPIGMNKFAYFASVMDVYSRKCVGWDVDIRIDAQLCLNALRKALNNRKGADLTGLVHHSDQGVQYASLDYRQLLEENCLIGSMSRKGNPYDNPFAERLFKTFKYEALYMREQRSFSDAYQLVSEFINDYNSERLHSAIGYLPPDEFENMCSINF